MRKVGLLIHKFLSLAGIKEAVLHILLKPAILYELERGGVAWYTNNRILYINDSYIQSIEKVKSV